MNYIEPIYKVNKNITTKELLDYYFKRYDGDIIYRFPVYKYNFKQLIFAEFLYDEDEHQIHIRVFDNNGNSYNYNKEEYGKSKLVEVINKRILEKINKFREVGIIIG